LVLGALTLSLGPRVAPETVTIKLNGLTRLFGEVVDNDRLGCHLHNVSWMGTVQLRTQQLREIVLLISSFLKGWTISSPLVGCRALMAYYG
jgi:hypothetical protein